MGPNTIPADLVFILKQEPHKRFVRQGADLIMTHEISLANALMGSAIDVMTLDGRLLKIPVNDTIRYIVFKAVLITPKLWGEKACPFLNPKTISHEAISF